LCAFYICTQGCGRIVRPAFPAPSDVSEGRMFKQTSRENARRDREAVFARGGLFEI
jgi:hypothetical protein